MLRRPMHWKIAADRGRRAAGWHDFRGQMTDIGVRALFVKRALTPIGFSGVFEKLEWVVEASGHVTFFLACVIVGIHVHRAGPVLRRADLDS